MRERITCCGNIALLLWQFYYVHSEPFEETFPFLYLIGVLVSYTRERRHQLLLTSRASPALKRKRIMANKANTSFKWSRNTTLLLISLIGKNYNQLQSGVKKFTFQQIAQEINEQLGTNLAFDQVESKWKGLRRTYKKVKESNTQLSWEFYNVVDEILQDDIEINPLVTATSEEAFITGCETEFDFIEYSVEPERSLFQQSRERGPSNDEDRYSREMRVGSSDEDCPGRRSRRRRISYEDRNGTIGRMYRSSDEDRRYRQIRKRRYNDDGQSDYETRRVQGNRKRIESAEAARERRHQEKMKLSRKFLTLFEKMVEKM